MQLSIDIPAEIEAVLRLRAEAAGEDMATFVRHVVVESLFDSSENRPLSASPAEFAQRLEAWIALHPVLGHAVDDSRDSIYAGRGE